MTAAVAAPERCPQCSTQLAPLMVACPRCGWLVHGEQLAALARSAREATERGDVSTALSHWREALALLPPSSGQHAIIAAKITALGQQLSASPVQAATGNRSRYSRTASGVGAIGLLAWKLKALVLGFGKASTLLSMLLSMGVYWTLWGWPFAVGLVLSIYVHEMGHVIALRRYGFKANAPMFIPGLGAYIRLQQHVVNPEEDAAIGLAGPIYGLCAALASASLWAITREPIFAAIAGVGAWVNLFNLLPFGTLDGGRAFHAMGRGQKMLATFVVVAAWFFTHDGLLILVGGVCGFRAFADKPQPTAGWRSAATYAALVIVLSVVSLMRIHAPVR